MLCYNSFIIIKRLNIFKEKTMPILEHFKTYPSYHEVNGNQPSDCVFQDVLYILEGKL